MRCDKTHNVPSPQTAVILLKIDFLFRHHLSFLIAVSRQDSTWNKFQSRHERRTLPASSSDRLGSAPLHFRETPFYTKTFFPPLDPPSRIIRSSLEVGRGLQNEIDKFDLQRTGTAVQQKILRVRKYFELSRVNYSHCLEDILPYWSNRRHELPYPKGTTVNVALTIRTEEEAW